MSAKAQNILVRLDTLVNPNMYDCVILQIVTIKSYPSHHTLAVRFHPWQGQCAQGRGGQGVYDYQGMSIYYVIQILGPERHPPPFVINCEDPPPFAIL